jgi:energy-coupling factor transport system ATP-binding protein
VLGFGVLNLLIDFRKFLKKSPKFLRPINLALGIALSLTPEVAQSFTRVKRASSWRAHRKGIRFVRSVIVPVISNAIDQSIALADSMESRGYGQTFKPATGAIELKNLNFAYRPNRPILSGVSISIPAGQFTLITGNTGSGKSTLLRVIEAKVPGVGFVSQFPRASFLGSTVFDELAFALIQQDVSSEDVKTRVNELAGKFNLDTKANPLELSAGWQQRVAIAAALSSGANILLLDEPFSALDDSGSRQLVETLGTLKAAGVTVIVAEHRLASIASLVDKCLRVSDGKVSETKPHALPLVRNISSGKVTAVVGENGSGKTTYLQKLAKDSGVLIPQPPSDLLFLETVAAELAQADLDALAPSGTTSQLLRRFLVEIDCSQNPRDLSEGQKLILALSIQLAKSPDLLMLDEPTIGLDTPNRQELVHIIGDLANRGVEVLVATHDREFAKAITKRTLEVARVRQ